MLSMLSKKVQTMILFLIKNNHEYNNTINNTTINIIY